ncbi:MAG TPA: trypsin-like peptidase domain-containing protein [Conexibacter sp.]|jgi:putative serine protease PepD|nr:trypsin-like peptidase domain-containing protein [Conexibacter sp.]
MGSPRHLWTGGWRDESERARDAAADSAELRRPPQPAAVAPAPAPAEPAERGGRTGSSRRLTLLLGLALAAAAIAGGAFSAGMLLDGGGSSGPAPLPAVASEPIKPHRGQTRAGAIYAAASPAVVSIRTNSGEGTGFLIEHGGTLVTNAHVVGTSTHVLVRFGQDGASLDGDVLGVDASSDLAVVAVDPAQVPRGAKALRFADSRAVQVGDLAVAIGNPFGLDRTATEGIVSGLGRSIQSPNGFAIDDVIQTDAPINPGNSGGPLLDDGGNVIGVNSQIATAGVAGNIGIGFAVPSNTVRQIVPQLEKGEPIARPWLGVTTTPASPTHPDGAQVADVVPGGPAARAGVQRGDVIKRIAGSVVLGPQDVAQAIGRDKPGDKADVVVDRGGHTQTLHATLGKRPARIP